MSVDLAKVVQESTLSKTVSQRYLSLYVADLDWEPHLNELWERTQRKFPNDVQGQMRRIVACTILLRAVDHNVPLDRENPQALLFRVRSYTQFKDRDWFAFLQKTIAKDIDIQGYQKHVLGLGIVDPIEMQPYCRQAFNWMYEKAEENGDIRPDTKDAVKQRLRSTVWAYGGVVICNIFENHKEQLRKVLNWRTGYFMERTIFRVYSVDQVHRMKRTELQNTSERLVKPYNPHK